MRIIYLHQYFLTPAMAGGTRSYEMARRLVAAGHDVQMITADQRPGQSARSWRETTEDGIRVHWARVPYDNQMGFAQRVRAFLEFAIKATRKAASLDGDLMFATSTPLTIAIPALLASAWKHRPYVFEVRDMWPDVPIAIGAIRNPLLVAGARWLEGMAYRNAAHVIALAPGMREDIIAKGIPAAKVTVIPNGCDLDLFAAPSRDPSPRATCSWLGARKFVLFAGTIGQVNGVDYLVHLAQHLLALDPEVRIVAIGGGAETEFIRGLAGQKGVLDRNFFMLDPMPKHELVRWLRAADLHIALFTGPRVVWKDAVQNKFFDALASGKPIANNFDGWQTRVAIDAGVGLMLDPHNCARGARQVLEALGNEFWLSQVAAKAAVLARGRFNRDTLARQLEQTLSAVLAGTA